MEKVIKLTNSEMDFLLLCVGFMNGEIRNNPWIKENYDSVLEKLIEVKKCLN